jgi:hypothetical protein
VEVFVGAFDGPYPAAAWQAAGLDVGHTDQSGDLNRCFGVP